MLNLILGSIKNMQIEMKHTFTEYSTLSPWNNLQTQSKVIIIGHSEKSQDRKSLQIWDLIHA